MRTDPHNKTHDYDLVKDEIPDSDTHDDKLVSTDDELVALALLRDQEIGFFAYTSISGGPITAEINGTMTHSIRADTRMKPTLQTNKTLLFFNVQHKNRDHEQYVRHQPQDLSITRLGQTHHWQTARRRPRQETGDFQIPSHRKCGLQRSRRQTPQPGS